MISSVFKIQVGSILLPCFLPLLASCSEPDAKDILRKSFEKCQSVENGYYEMTHYMKYMTSLDTSISTFKCYFRKLHDDSIYDAAFHYRSLVNESYTKAALYTGDEFVSYSESDSSGNLMSKALWAADIKSYRHNYTFYQPLVSKNSDPFPDDSSYMDASNLFDYMGDVMINGTRCSHIRWIELPELDPEEMIQTLRIEKNFWISKADQIPVQYSVAYDLVMNNDTMRQYERNLLTKYELNEREAEGQLELASIPPFIQLKEYQPFKAPPLLPKDTIAPSWTLQSIHDEVVSLSDLKGELVLVDFFYKSCYPCIQALPALQALHEKYGGKGFRMIGIDPYDDKEQDNMATFLKKHGVTYTVLFGAKQVAKDYRVSGYPTMYLIDKNGKVLFTQVGYGEGIEKSIEDQIMSNLD